MASKVSPIPREWFRITCQADPAVADIYIYDLIGEVVDFWTDEVSGVSATNFLGQMQALPAAVKTIRIHLNSPGGNWADSVAIANLLREQSRDKGRTVEVLIEALAASGATLVSSAGDAIKIASNALMMIHGPSAQNRSPMKASELRSMADGLDSMSNTMVTTYRWVSQMSPDEIKRMMDATTWMSAEQALANGFVTEIIQPVAVIVQFDPRSIQALGEIPEAYRDRVAALTAKAPPAADAVPDPAVVAIAATDPPSPHPAAPAVVAQAQPAPPGLVPATATEILAAVEMAGLGTAFARTLIEAKVTLDEATAQIGAAKEEARIRTERETEIRGLCATAKFPELADSYIAARVPPAQVKAQLTLITAKMDGVEITTALPANGGTAPLVKTGITTAEVYRLRAEIAARAREGRREPQ